MQIPKVGMQNLFKILTIHFKIIIQLRTSLV